MGQSESSHKCTSDGTYDTRTHMIHSHGVDESKTIHRGVSSYWETTTHHGEDGHTVRECKIRGVPAAHLILRVGDQVSTTFGLGTVQSIRKEDSLIQIQLNKWKLANNQSVYVYAMQEDVKFCARPMAHTHSWHPLAATSAAIAVVVER